MMCLLHHGILATLVSIELKSPKQKIVLRGSKIYPIKYCKMPHRIEVETRSMRIIFDRDKITRFRVRRIK